ncbi:MULTISPECIES: ABC transporter ATP-binding protein [Bacillus]|uniref:ABC transporter ATP-binding protein n=1 Tax=Bacillus TaxID=1386 RepID=UPI00032F549F|nr:ABC transporter ATP-binding protein [Bacillus wiedmannii]EOP08026.1 ABC transporter ATP-binding protein [Bacillus cereus BAG2O-3]EOQ13274.1 ABC transporter ATP-binding protein [Bacillus cereus B5-2]EOQ34088.1 ABC transporter ATP-binding protein [Bacillus cereus BAG3O-1]MDA1600140.1 ABC transporter ATP-binding protein [Bacillus cereus]PFW82904.1 ABC transporter ATP-binding protein [Bacillus sp. AFS075960]RFB10503.1 ABC transporter ATP-binding protein [Bacillus sp. OE]RFB48712.1 ABC transpo
MTALLKIENLWKRYGLKAVIRELNIEITEGKIIGLVGDNGSGKTTLLKMIAGLQHPSEGSITIAGKKVGLETKEIVSFMSDKPVFDDWMTVKDSLFFYRDFYKDFDIQKAVDTIAEFKIPLEEKITALSKGMVEKLQIILTFSRKAKLYVLDEPLGGIDLVSREHVLELILQFYREDCTILIATHLIGEVENIFDEVIFLKDGESVLHENVEELRFQRGKAVTDLFKEVFSR